MGLTLLGLAVGGGAEELARAVSTAATGLAEADPSVAKALGAQGIDYATTGAIKGQPALSPCQR